MKRKALGKGLDAMFPNRRKCNHLWVVEMRMIDGKWDATVGAYLCREDARRYKQEDWEWNNPDEKFRIRKYVSVKP